MRIALAVQAIAQAVIAQHLHRSGFEYARADTAQVVVPGLTFQHDAVDAICVQDMRKQQAGRPAANDDDACSFHNPFPLVAAVPRQVAFSIAMSPMPVVIGA